MNKQKRRLHLISNAHLDPVWLWDWEEGAAEAISTFRSAADICEERDDFIFCHNEVILYQWVEEYEPPLFKRIQRLVKEGKWHIMGGWFLQPDCNMPSGESFVRQMLVGRQYFQEKFGVRPTTSINFDPFGHSRGLVQIMAKSGFDSYLICRPNHFGDFQFPPENIITWVGFDGSEVLCLRAPLHYSSRLGQVREKLERHFPSQDTREVQHLIWGVGNHGGGPSRQDLDSIAEFAAKKKPDVEFIHSTPEGFFADWKSNNTAPPRVEKSLNRVFPGCYTSQVRIKQKHRELENLLFLTEKMCSSAMAQGLMEYPVADLKDAQQDLLVAEFHDILPGSSIQPVEEMSLRVMDHALEKLTRIRARAFFALSTGEPKPPKDQVSILVYNPHPYDITTTFDCEFSLIDQNRQPTFMLPIVYQGHKEVLSQVEKEESNINMDWRKRVAIRATLKAGQMNHFNCSFKMLPEKPTPKLKAKAGKVHFKTDELEVVINSRTGLMDLYIAQGQSLLRPKAFLPVVIDDNEDPWSFFEHQYSNQIGQFKLLPPEKGTEISGSKTKTPLKSVRIVEDGPLHSVVEALMGWGDSFLVMTYKLPKAGTEVEVHLRVFWNEKDKMLKLSIPTQDKSARCVGDVAYGREDLDNEGLENIAQKWIAALSEEKDQAVTLINNGSYGFSCRNGELRPTLLRSPAYAALPIGERDLVPQNRFVPRIDQGERQFTFWLNGGSVKERMEATPREAQVHGEKPFALSFFPSGEGKKAEAMAKLSDKVVQLTALKKAENNNDLIIRLFEPTGKKRRTTLNLPALGIKHPVSMGAFEIKTLRVSKKTRRVREVNLMEE